MDSKTNDFNVWQNQVPVVVAGIDGEFDIWQDKVPVEDRDEGVIDSNTRRRVVEF